ncbi:MAG: efflux transporter outer membrane subunit [Piscinibacter sp.]|nr:efflux transporter outer membrane subunit [Piscinibacter sp.]
MNPSTLLKTSAALLAASALSGCMQLAPRYERPAAPVPATFPNATSVPSGTAAADLTWQDYFADPALRALIELALKNNRDLRVAVLNIEAVRAQYQLRRADQLPTLNAGLTASRAPGTGGNNVSAYSAGLSVAAYEVDLFGRVRSLTDSAAAQVLASEESRRVVQISLIASVANQYLALAADEELLDLTLRTLDTREQSLKLTQLRFDNGAASELDLRQAQTLAEAARVTLAQQRRQRELDRNALALLLGQALPEWPAAPGRVSAIALADVPAGVPSEVLLRRPDVAQAEQQLVAANASIGAARAAFWPRITLTASAGTASTQLSDLFKDGAWSFAAQLLQPIFDAGRNRANLAVAEVQRDIAVAQYERAIQAAFRDVADALAGRATLDDQVRATQAQADAEQARYRLSELRFRNGVSSSLELLDAERSLFAVQQAVVQTQLALLQNRVSTYRALGGGNLGAAGQ